MLKSFNIQKHDLVLSIHPNFSLTTKKNKQKVNSKDLFQKHHLHIFKNKISKSE